MCGRLALLFLPTPLVGEGDAVGSYPLFRTNKIIKNLGAHKVTVVKVAEKCGFFDQTNPEAGSGYSRLEATG